MKLKDCIEYISNVIERDKQYIANLLGITHSQLDVFKDLNYEDFGDNTGDLSPTLKRADRIRKLYFTIQLLEILCRDNNLKELNILHDGRIIIDPTDEEYGDCSLLGYITMNLTNDDSEIDLEDIKNKTIDAFKEYKENHNELY